MSVLLNKTKILLDNRQCNYETIANATGLNIDWLKKYHDEFETTIKKFESEADLNDYLTSIHNVDHFKKENKNSVLSLRFKFKYKVTY